MALCSLVKTHLSQAFASGHARFKPLNVKPWNHQGCQRSVVQVKDISDHLMLMRFNQACVHALLQARRDFLLGHGAVAACINAQQFQYCMGAKREQTYKGSGNTGQPSHGPGHNSGNWFWIQLANSFWHQLTKNDGGEGNRSDHQASGRRTRNGFSQAKPHQPSSDSRAKSGLSKDAVHHPDRRNAHLNRRQKLGGVFKQFECGGCPFVTRLFHGGQSCFSA